MDGSVSRICRFELELVIRIQYYWTIITIYEMGCFVLKAMSYY